MLNDDALTYWRRTGYTDKQVLDVWLEISDDLLAALIIFDPERGATITLSQKVAKTGQGHAPFVEHFLSRQFKKWKGERPEGAVIFLLEDGMWTGRASFSRRCPIFAHGKSIFDNQTLLMPDAMFLEMRAYEDTMNEIREHEKLWPWEKKRKKIFWRGANSGPGMRGDNWRASPRIKLAELSKQINNPDILDAWIGKAVDYGDEEITNRVVKAGYVKDFVPLKHFFENRYLVYIEGEHCTWPMHFYTLSSGCAVLKVESVNEQWYYNQLRPWTHYIPVEPSLRDMKEVIEWVFAHDQDCRQIAKNATAFMKTLEFERVEEEFKELILNVLRCRREKY